MSTLADLLAAHTGLTDEQAGHLQRLVGEWQLLADLSFADLLLSVPDTSTADDQHPGLLTVAQCRPNTAATVLPGDEVTRVVDDQQAQALRTAMTNGEIIAAQGSTLGGIDLRRDLIPVRHDGRVIAVLTQASANTARRVPSPLERAYQASAADLCNMVADGTFPVVEGSETGLSTPRAGDGFVRVGVDGLVQYASPNALSAFHRMGFNSDLSGAALAEVFTELVSDAFDAQDAASMITLAASGPALEPAADAQERVLRMEVDARRATVLVRVVPLRPRGVATGAIVLVRDVTEVKRRDRALISKDATIREIHHRVKNNLQSVSALLRLQARRTANPDARTALNEAVRRVASIALVHEFLSGSVDEEVDVDEVVNRLLPVLVDATSRGAAQAQVNVDGRFGVLSADLAMPLVMVLTELIQNSVEHGFADGRSGRIDVVANRGLRELEIRVSDNGTGIPEDFDLEGSGSLGLQIVRTLVEIDLGGNVEFANAPGGGTSVRVVVPVVAAEGVSARDSVRT
ncbi:putative two-component histidine kinase [Gordonia araii NBRC 100433]|uniref:histidine kinase n=1 Tax=Gordonia araii NBRC 100433 TaxID=1073574 RepID=G7H2C4_9ACTN|nr:PAS domain-containing sensor histidine kinase [Gordonia araii]NNG97538.1 PAS domain-containing protein [Gordonia araii NBRC 100433]GAB09999.1 putative two-component histidine kinase [Gordonia araii NBRC 100433]